MAYDWLSWKALWRDTPLRSALGKRILTWLLLLSLVPLTASNNIGYLSSSRIVGNLASRDLNELAAVLAHHVSDEIERHMHGLAAAVHNDRLLLASAAAFRDPAADPILLTGSSGLAAAELARLRRQLPDYTSLELIAPNGVVVASSPRFASGTVRMHGGSTDRVEIDGDSFSIERVGATDTAESRLVFSVALFAADRLPSVTVTGTIEGEGIGRALQLSSSTLAGVEASVVDVAGRPVYVSNAAGVGDVGRLPGPVAVREGTRRHRDAQGREMVRSIHQVPGHGLYLVSEVPVGAALGALQALRRLSIMLGLAFALVVVAAAWVVSGGVVRPVYKLVAATKRIERGDLGASVEVTTRDEIGQLGQRFNAMAEQLQESAERIQRYHQEELRRADQLATVGQLAAGIAHELKSPLLGITSGVRLLHDRLADGDVEGAHLADETLHRIAGMERAVQSLLNYARPSPARKAHLDLSAVVRRAVRLVEPRADRSGVEIRCRLATDLPAVLMDPELIGQLVVNLVLNGIEAVDGTGWLEVVTCEDADTVLLTVTDSGPGIGAADSEQIFRPFFTTKHRGTGLGLSIVRQTVEQHGGHVTAANRPGAGAQFTVSLPVAVSGASLEVSS